MKPNLSCTIREYTRLQVETAPVSGLVCMLHSRCAVLLRQALLDERAFRRPVLDKAQNILALLQRSLKGNDATSRTLFHLYDYCYCRLEGEIAMELEHALAIIESLAEVFDNLRKRRWTV